MPLCAAAALLALLAASPPAVAPARDDLLARARAAAAKRPSEARALYRELLARDASDDEARAGLAFLDLWERHPRDAEGALREVLTRHPGDGEVRAALVDALARQLRFGEAESEAARGLAAAPGDPQLLLRKARLERIRGDESAARSDALAAERVLPRDSEVQSLLDSIRRGEVQELVRDELHPGADDVHVLELSVVQSVGPVLLGLRTEQSQRFASVTPNRGYNALYAVSATAPLGAGFSAGLELGAGSPAPAVPQRAARVAVEGPLPGPTSFALSYTLWSFSPVTVHLVQPVLSVGFGDRLRLDLRYAFSDVLLSGGAGRATHSAGGGLTWLFRPRISLSAGYFHGVQLDRGPNLRELIDVRSDFFTAAADLRFSRSAGVRPVYTLEQRTQPASATIHSLQLALYQRW